MSEAVPAPRRRAQPSRERRVLVFVALVTVLAALVALVVVRREIDTPSSDVDWRTFSLFALLLLVAETRPTFWLRFGDGGEITPGWAFAFALLLLGSPTGAMACMATATLLSDAIGRKSIEKVVFNVAQVTLSLALGALVLAGFGLTGPMLANGHMSFVSSLGMIVAGLVVLGTNSMLLFAVMAISRGVSLMVPWREGWLTSVSADGALLAVAPIFVVAVEFSLLLLPLLCVTSFIVFSSARQAMREAHAASHDQLTRLLNRSAFIRDLDRLLANDDGTASPTTLLLIDLDGFKEVNDRLGHQVGDELLRVFASRLERAVPTSAIAARLGGDEFAVALRRQCGTDQVAMARELLRRLSAALNVHGFPLSIGMSIGMAFAPEHGRTPEELLASADIAMYRAKRYRTGVEVYAAVGASREVGRLGLLGDLTSAIDAIVSAGATADGATPNAPDQLSVGYQPLVRLATGRTESVEALLRWTHPTFGNIPPDEFIALAEHTDLIGPLTSFVLDRAVGDIARLDWELAVAVNVSARNLQDRHFPDLVLATLLAHGLAPHRLEIEITESAIACEPERSRFAINALRESGIRVSIDDFGTGYSSYSSLRDLSVDRLKIDRSFISHLTPGSKDAVLVRSIVNLAGYLGLETVAEGIEDQLTLELLTDLGCDFAQGYQIAHPMNGEQLIDWLASDSLDLASTPLAPSLTSTS